MKLYLNDINKAIASTPNVSQDEEDEKQSTLAYDHSYTTVHPGVSGASDLPDKPDQGKKWKEEGETVEDEVESKRKELTQESKQNKVTKATETLNDFNKSMSYHLSILRPNDLEVYFLTEILGYEEEDVYKGLATIRGKDRHRFDQWLCSRLTKSIDDILPKSRRDK